MITNNEIATILMSKEVGKILADEKQFHTELFWLCYRYFFGELTSEEKKFLIYKLIDDEEYRQELLK